jgi:hypothetical protein
MFERHIQSQMSEDSEQHKPNGLYLFRVTENIRHLQKIWGSREERVLERFHEKFCFIFWQELRVLLLY